MLRARPLIAARAALIVAFALGAMHGAARAQSSSATPSTSNSAGSSCASQTNGTLSSDGESFVVCTSGLWVTQPVIIGTTAASCTTTGMTRYDSAAGSLDVCNGSGWNPVGSGSSTALSALTSSTTSDSFDNAAYQQIWTWNSLSTQTALTISSSSLTTGSLLSLQDTAAAATSTGKVLNLSDSTTGPGYVIYSSITGAGNTGYAGYFTNNAHTAAGYALYGTTSTTAAGYGVYGNVTGTNNSGYGIYGSNASTSGYAGYFSGTVYVSGAATASTSLTSPLIIGGTAVGSTLTLESTSTAGTSDSIILKTGHQSTAITITTTQSVGIGTTTPAQTLEVNGNAQIDNAGDAIFETTSNAANGWITAYSPYGGGGGLEFSSSDFGTAYEFMQNPAGVQNIGALFYLDGSSNNYLGIYNAGAAAQTVRLSATGTSWFDGGSIGIGTTSPASKMQFESSTGAPGGLSLGAFYDGSAVVYAPGYVGFNAARNEGAQTWGTTNDNAHNGGAVIAGDVYGNIDFFTLASTGTANQSLTDAQVVADQQMIITGSGSVGIGTTVPLNSLDVRNGGAYQINVMTSTATGSNAGTFGADGNGFARILGAAGIGLMATSTTEAVRITTSGTVGIGTTVPSGLLHVYDPNSTANAVVYGIYESGALSATDTSGFIYGGEFAPSISATTTVSTIAGVTGQPQNTSSGWVGSMSGLQAVPQLISSGTVNSMYGVRSIPQVSASGTGTVGSMYGLYTYCSNNNASATTTNCFEIYLDTPVATGTISHKYGVYQVDANSTNYFNGKVGIGTASPGATLAVSGAALIGTDSATCAAGIAGELEWTGSALEYCNGTSWALIGTASGGTSGALSGLLTATATNTIDNVAYPQSWSWNSLSTGTAFKLSSSSMTSGTVLALANTSTPATGKVLSVTTSGGTYGIYSSAAGTGNTYAVYGEDTGSGNTGVAGYFYNKDTSGANYGVYGKSDSTSGSAVYANATASSGSTAGVQAFDSSPSGIALGAANVSTTGSAIAIQGTTDSTGTGFAIYGAENGAGNTGYAGYFANSATSGANYGVYGANYSTGTGVGVYGIENGAANTGYAGYFNNTATSGASYGIAAFTNGDAGHAVAAFANSTTGNTAGVYTTNASNGGAYGVFANMSGASNVGVAVFAQNQGTTGANYGLYASTSSTSGIGVSGNAFNTSGTTYGVYGTVNSGSGYGVYANNTGGSACNGYLASGSNSAGGNCKSSFSSDRRMKRDIVEIPDGLKIVLALKPVSYLWKSERKNPPLVTDPTKKARGYGFIAQDVEQVLPDLVDHGAPGIGKIEGLPEPADGFLELNYDGIIAPTVKAVQELQAEIEELKAADEELKADNADLRQQIALLRRTKDWSAVSLAQR